MDKEEHIKTIETGSAEETGSEDMRSEDVNIHIPGLPEDFAHIVAAIQGRKSPSDKGVKFAEGYSSEDVLRYASSGKGEDEEENSDPRNFAIGQHIEGKGIYIGVYRVERRGHATKTFDLYAAPEDLDNHLKKRVAITFRNAVNSLNYKLGWHGYDGECYSSHKRLRKAMEEDTYRGGWFIPTKEMLVDMYKYKNTGALKGTFKDVAEDDIGHWYWSSSGELIRNNVRFTDGKIGWDRKESQAMSVRPVRAELRI